MLTKGNRLLAAKGNVSEMGISRLVSTLPFMGFLISTKSEFPIYVLSHDIEALMFRKIHFLVTIFSTLNYVPPKDSRLMDPPRKLCTKSCTLGMF